MQTSGEVSPSLRPASRLPLEANNESLMQRRYMGVEAMGEVFDPPPTNETLQLPPKAA